MITQAVVAAAGRGTRMGDLTRDRPKHLIPVNGKPFLYYLLSDLVKAGYKDLVVVAGDHADMVGDFLKEYFPSAQLVNQFEILGAEKYGTACTVQCVSEMVGARPFVMVYGDNLYSVADLARMNRDDGFHAVAGMRHDHPEQYGVLLHEGEMLQRIVEKPKTFVGDLINTGLYTFTSEIFSALVGLDVSVRGEYELTDAVSFLAQQGKVKIVTLVDFWMDFGKPADIPVLEAFLKKRK